MASTPSLFDDEPLFSGPVECLGQTFPNDDARREHYLAILREKLKDPAFRKIEGFPIGSDEDILALSDPPYYTACPNPFIEDFIKHYGTRYNPDVPYSKEPYVADVSEGKNDPIYNAHSYHTKVPHKAIMRYLLHYTQPGDLVFDGFCGTGMTGVAAQLCGDRSVVASLGYRVEADGQILAPEQTDGESVWRPIARLGARRALLSDLSPAATLISYNYNTPTDLAVFDMEARKILSEVESEYGWMYQTLHDPTDAQIAAALDEIERDTIPDLTVAGVVAKIAYTIWSDVFSCPECAEEIVFWDVAVNQEANEIREEFLCPQCSAALSKKLLERTWVRAHDKSTSSTTRLAKQVPVLINYRIGRKGFFKKPDRADLALFDRIEKTDIPHWFPTDALPAGDKMGEPLRVGITHAHLFHTKRDLAVIAAFLDRAERAQSSRLLKLCITSLLVYASKASRWRLENKSGPLSGTWYISSTVMPLDAMTILPNRIRRLAKAKASVPTFRAGDVIVSCVSSTHLTNVGGNSVDYLFLDPPFGANLMYSELSFLWEVWLRVKTAISSEAIANKSQNKSLDEYRRLMTLCFLEAFRILKPGRWMTVEFSNTRATVWNGIQTALQEAGFVVANVAALDKKQGSFKAVTTTTAVKQDLVISAYKPNGGLEERFARSGGSEESAWDFVRSHLRYLPTVKLQHGQLEQVVEREPRIIFDRLVAWFVRHSFPVPLSSQEFQAGLTQRFAERDGMVFLSDQVTEYDKKRHQIARAPQMELFIADERSAIDWLTDFLKKRPSTYQEVHPEFIQQLGAGWKKHEAKPELSDLLEANFLCYDPKSKDGYEVPPQIHSYLSTNWADMRNLDKTDERLKKKATGRWYVPNPNKARDLEMVRERALLKEFETYRAHKGRRLKVFRLEAMRAGFRNAWANKDYATIIAVAKKVPEEALQEDEKLLLWYDQALTLSETGG
ncbi:DNA methyltransferase [Thiohalocapsa sp. ML1]|uniref:DNA methyltransferase n=1 Tax=Thiohalocapsa sp. ML1 TaxID=1431688 RepID=UPI00073235C6|nr:DNA methyltransferase [Thiohalocapsa sp. ML1]